MLRLSICVQSFLQKQLGSGVAGFGLEERTTDVHTGFELCEPRHDKAVSPNKAGLTLAKRRGI